MSFGIKAGNVHLTSCLTQSESFGYLLSEIKESMAYILDPTKQLGDGDDDGDGDL